MNAWNSSKKYRMAERLRNTASDWDKTDVCLQIQMYSIQINLHLQIYTRDDLNEQEFAVEKKNLRSLHCNEIQRILNGFKRGCISFQS